MNIRHRLATGLAAAATLAIASLPLASAANATPLPQKKPPCPANKTHGNPYPPGLCKATLSSSAVHAGGSLTVSGNGFFPGEGVLFTLHSAVVNLTTVTALTSGVATATVTIPATTKPGTHEIVLYGQQSTNEVSATFTVTAAAGASHSSKGSNLPFTGAAEAIPLGGAGAAMVVAGGLMLLSVRRRRRPVAH